MELADLVQKHDDVLYRGNGRPGITTRMAVCEERIDGVKDDIEKINKNQAWAMRFTIMTLIGLAVEILVNLSKR